ncbi:MAG: M48 family metalloprotease, partial [Victivallaceae bacterium]
MEKDKVYFSYQQVRSNFFKTYLLVIIMALLAFGVATLIGYFLNDLRMGLLIGAVVALVVIPLEILTAKIAIKTMTRGRDLDMNNQQERDLHRVVEGLAIAAGLKRTPEVFIVPSNVPNAFASGMSEKDAFIGVTQGLIDTLKRSELEGVIAHEISHIVHRDIMVSQLVVGLVSVILILVFIAERIAMVRSMGERRRSNDNDNNAAAAIALVALLVFILLRPLAYLIAS